ncbi:MAG: GntR family transcriptional regulator [Salinibacterium sp.]|nr:GntR family transcriptional regulator [Salinibacterium sp.]
MNQLRSRLLEGFYAPGEALTAADLALDLGMSRTPVREALRTLASEGLIDMEMNRVARAADWSARKIESIFEIRMRLEGLSSRITAQKISVTQIDELDHLARRIQVVGDPGPDQDLITTQDLNADFHARIIAIADSPALTTAMTGVVHAALLTRTRAAYTEGEQRRSSQHHIELVCAFRAGSADWAESVMRSHLLQGKFAVLRGEPTETEGGDDGH